MKKILFLMMMGFVFPAFAGNTEIASFTKAKKLLTHVVYAEHNETFYCKGHFDLKNNIILPE